MTRAPDVIGRWYVDADTGARFKLLMYAEETVDVIDEWGNRRRVNRLMWDTEMVLITRQPVGAS